MSDLVKGIEEEVALMNKSFDGGIATESPPTDPPSTNAPGTSPPGTKAPGTDAPSTETPTTEEPTTEVPEDKDATIDSLRKTIEELQGKPKTLAPGTGTPKTEAPTTEAPLELEDQDFVGELDLEEVGSDPRKMNEVFNKIYRKAVADTKKLIGEGVLRTIPDIVKANIRVMNTLKEVSDKFYANNEDLKPYKKVVAAVFEEVASKNPDRGYNDLLGDVETEVRKRLDLKKKAAGKKEKLPRLPQKKGKSGREIEKPDTSPIEDEIGEMNKTLGR